MPPIAEEMGRADQTLPQGQAEAGSATDTQEPISMIQVTAVSRKQSRKQTTMDQYSTDSEAAKEFFKKEPCIYSHRMFDRAAKIFEGLKRTREQKERMRMTRRGVQAKEEAAKEPEIPPMDFKGPAEKKLTFELAFSSLKYHNVFNEILEDCAFFTIYPDLKDQETLVMVVLWDFQSRKFQPRIQFDAAELIDDILRIERAILEQKTKLAASLARRRIKASAPNIEYLLPDKFRTNTKSENPMPAYAWVNTIKIHPTEMLQRLKDDGFTQLWTVPKTIKEFGQKSFYLDPHCSDLLVFSVDCNTLLQEYGMVEEGYLIRQDKSSCLAAHSVIPMLSDEHDVIVVNPGPGLTAAHLAVLLKDRKCGVVVVSDTVEDDHHKMLRNFELIGVSRFMKLIREDFTQLDLEDPRLKLVRAALVTADCSKSAINNIVNYIVTEGENLRVLQDVADTSDEKEDRSGRFQTAHVNVLRQALKLLRIQGVTYMTRSVNDYENDAVVQRAIEYVNMLQMAKKLRPWRVIPPVIPYSAEEIEEQVGICGKHIWFQPSEMMNGCFIVCIAREPEDPAEVVARARGKGLGGKSSKNKLKTSDQSDSSESVGKGRKKSQTKRSKTASSKAPKVSANGAAVRSASVSRLLDRKVPEHHRVVRHPAPFR